MKVLREVGQTVESTLDLDSYDYCCPRCSTLGTDGGLIYEYDEQREDFILRATHGMEEEVVKELRAHPIRLGEGAVGRAAVARKPIAF